MKISDSHTDFLTSIENVEVREDYIREISTLDKHTISCAVFTTDKDLRVNDIKNYAEELAVLRNKYDINLLLSIEDLGFMREDKDLTCIIKLNPISATLTWNLANQFGGGANSDIGLTSLGKEYVKILENNNILIDTAHMSRRTFWDFVRITKLPIYNSHSNIYSLKRHKRNLTDKQIAKIVETNGYLGLTFYDKFISKGKITAQDIAHQFDYLIKKFGYHNFGLGTDLYGIDISHLPTDLKAYQDIDNLAHELKNLGHTDEIINCITCKNFENFLIRIKK